MDEANEVERIRLTHSGVHTCSRQGQDIHILLKHIQQVHDAAVRETAEKCFQIADEPVMGNEKSADSIRVQIKQHFGLEGEK